MVEEGSDGESNTTRKGRVSGCDKASSSIVLSRLQVRAGLGEGEKMRCQAENGTKMSLLTE